MWGCTTAEFWLGNSAFLAHNYWLHCLYSKDTEFLRKKALPIIEKSFLAYYNLLYKGKDGKLHIPYSYSPEYYEGYVNAYDEDSNIDIALLKFLTSSIVKAHKELRIENSITKKALYVKENIVDFQVEGPLKNRINEINWRKRLKISKNIPFRMSHRHFSHLLSIYPLGILSIEHSKKERELIRGSIEEVIRYGTGAWTGYSFPWFSAISARAGYKNLPLQMLEIYLNGFISPNSFHINGDPKRHGLSMWSYQPMTLEGGFMAAASILEMLLQSYDGVIRVFPAIPDVWSWAEFKNLRAEGAFLVSSEMVNGKVKFIEIKSEKGGKCKVKKNFSDFSMYKCKKNSLNCSNFKNYKIDKGVLEFYTEKGAIYRIEVKNFGALKYKKYRIFLPNFFGKKRTPNF